MLSSDTTATPDPDVLFTKLSDGEAVLLHLGVRSYFSLNESAAHIWDLMSAGLSVGDISERLEAKFDVSLEHARTSVQSLIDELAGQKLVTVTTG